MILLIDAGNSCLKWNIYAEKSERLLFDTQKFVWNEGTTEEYFDRAWSDQKHIEQVVVANVKGSLFADTLSSWVQRQWQLEAQYIQATQQCLGVTNAYPQVQQLGVDRWVGLLYAHTRFPNQAACVIDCGTAITIDAVDSHGQHLGGLIAPGPETMLHSLDYTTANIKWDNSAKLNGIDLASNTQEGIKNGVYLAILGLMNEAVNQIANNLECAPKVIVSGGYVEPYLAQLPQHYIYEPDMVLTGLALLSGQQQ